MRAGGEDERQRHHFPSILAEVDGRGEQALNGQRRRGPRGFHAVGSQGRCGAQESKNCGAHSWTFSMLQVSAPAAPRDGGQPCQTQP